MPAPAEHLGQFHHMRLHSSGDIEGVRADHSDLHRRIRPFDPGATVLDQSASHSGCSMCQSVGWAAMLRA